MLISAADDGHFKIWDLRTNNFTFAHKASDESICVGAFNQLIPNLFVVGGDPSGQIQLWDLRFPKHCLLDMSSHKQQVISLDWHPTRPYLFASGSDDGQVIIWDVENNGTDPTHGGGEDGPPTLLFPHEMHKSAIEDIAWRPSHVLKGDTAKDLLLGSLETQNVFHVY